VLSLTNAVALAAGTQHTCALLADAPPLLGAQRLRPARQPANSGMRNANRRRWWCRR